MRAALVTSFGTAPVPAEIDEPTAQGDNGMTVDVLAVGLHPRVMSQANGSHYTSTDELPLVPGVDGVGRDADGMLRYFILEDTTHGSMAERVAIDPRRSIVLPDDADPVAIAAAMNPAMSSWVALRQRIDFPEGPRVLVLGATGNAGRMAVQVARLFGAGQVIAAGRDAEQLAGLPSLGATDTVLLDDDAEATAARLGSAASEVDVVIDYLWGSPTATAMTALVTARADRSKPLSWIEVGSVAGPTAAIPSAALRATRLQIVGSGQGSVSTAEILAELSALAAAISAGTLASDARVIPLADVERAWAEAGSTRQRIVITP